MTKKQIKDHLEAMIAWRDGELADYIESLQKKADDVTVQDADAENPTVPLPPKPPGVS